MNRMESKCVGKVRYKTLAAARAHAKDTNGIYEAHGCECRGFHISKVKRTPHEEARAQAAEYYGAFEPLVRAMINREVERMRKAGARKRKVARA